MRGSFTDLFIRRPVLASVVSLLILFIGIEAFSKLQIRQYPQLESTSITVTTTYPGANADLIKGFITTPLAQAVASAEGVDTLVSNSQQNVSTITLSLRLHANADRAVADVLSKVNQVRGQLPRRGVQVGHRGARQFELATGLQRHGGVAPGAAALQADRVGAVGDRLPVRAGQAFQQVAYPARPVRHGGQVRAAEHELLVFRADAPLAARLAAGGDVLGQLLRRLDGRVVGVTGIGHGTPYCAPGEPMGTRRAAAETRRPARTEAGARGLRSPPCPRAGRADRARPEQQRDARAGGQAPPA